MGVFIAVNPNRIGGGQLHKLTKYAISGRDFAPTFADWLATWLMDESTRRMYPGRECEAFAPPIEKWTPLDRARALKLATMISYQGLDTAAAKAIDGLVMALACYVCLDVEDLTRGK